MKEYLLLIIIIFTTIELHSQTKSGEITYKIMLTEQYKNQGDTIKSPAETKEKTTEEAMAESYLAKIFEKQEKMLPFVNYKLTFTNNEAFFFLQESMGSDSGQDLNDALPGTGTEGEFYTNLSEDLNLHKFQYDQLIIVESKVSDLKWEIDKETKNIAGYECQKATTKIYVNSVHPEKEISVWFTKDLPFSFGPAGMVGLPGMILGYERFKFFIYADKVKLSKKNKKITKPTKGKKVKQDYIIKVDKELEKRYKRN